MQMRTIYPQHCIILQYLKEIAFLAVKCRVYSDVFNE